MPYTKKYSDVVDKLHNSSFYGLKIDSYILDTLSKLGLDNKGKVLVELGCNKGILLSLLSSNYKVLGLELVPVPDRELNEVIRDKVIYTDLNDPLPLGDGYADIFVSTNVLEHIKNINGLVQEVNRCLKPGGCFINIVPFEIPGLRGHTHLRTSWKESANKDIKQIIKNMRECHVYSFRILSKIFPGQEHTISGLVKGTDLKVLWRYSGIRFLYGPWIAMCYIKK